jgi:release factor glutamine methyltransferase
MISNTQLSIRAFLAQCDVAKVDARLLIEHFYQLNKADQLRNDEQLITLYPSILDALSRLQNDEPIEYITERVSFYAEEFIITPGVLIPRPETELLIDEVVKRLKDHPPFTMAEIGIGSGIISIMLSKLLPNITHIYATDINPIAIDLTKRNIDYHDNSTIEVRESSLLDSVSERVEVIVSNPPYIANDYVIDKNLTYEPSSALFGGDEGDELLKEIIDLAFEREVKILACEMGYDQKDKITHYLKERAYLSLEFYRDYSGFDRGFVLTLR